MGGGWKANPSLALVSEGIPNAPFTGYSGADLTLAEGRERGVDDGEVVDGYVTDGAETVGAVVAGEFMTACVGETDGSATGKPGESNSCANTLGVCTLGVDTLGVGISGIDTLGECTLGGVDGAAGK